MRARINAPSCCLSLFLLSGCGLYTPAKDLTMSENFTPDSPGSEQGNYETSIINHLECEIALGLLDAQRWQLPWLNGWGVTVTWSLTAEDQSGLAPGVALINPMQNAVFSFPSGGNVISPQSFSLSVGATASANGLRTEMIQFTVRNSDLLKYVTGKNGENRHCNDAHRSRVFIDGDLKIREFIYDKATMASTNNLNVSKDTTNRPAYNTWTEEITFVAAYGGSLTPTWKLARVTANTSSNLIVAERTITNDLVITLGPLLSTPAKQQAVQLISSAMSQHNARVSASAIAVSISGQSH